MSRTVKNTQPYPVDLPTLGVHLEPGETAPVPADVVLAPYLTDVKAKPAKSEEQ